MENKLDYQDNSWESWSRLIITDMAERKKDITDLGNSIKELAETNIEISMNVKKLGEEVIAMSKIVRDSNGSPGLLYKVGTLEKDITSIKEDIAAINEDRKTTKGWVAYLVTALVSSVVGAIASFALVHFIK